jgi:AraC-like DNA-binding protein
MEQVFLNRLNEIIEANLHNEQFSVAEISRKMALSRSGIHRRLKSITKQSLTQYVREYRLQKAMEMLRHHEATASEIAFRVGFSSPAYFNKCFHEYFGYPPGEVKKSAIPESGNSVFAPGAMASGAVTSPHRK